MAATDTRSGEARQTTPGGTVGAIVAAALALPGITLTARAENAPEHGQASIKYLSYQDSQPDLTRVKVTAPSVYLLVPMGSQWSLEASGVLDAVSGASPTYHTAVSGASKMSDYRKAADVKLTRYESRSSYSLGLSTSNEHDYQSNAVSMQASFDSDDNNTKWTVGVGYASDKISSVNDLLLHETKRTTELLLGVTQALSPYDLVQLNLTYSNGNGYYSDPYKVPDVRPAQRNEFIVLARWNHFFEGTGATLRSSYRFYNDSFGIKAHTLGAEWVQPIFDRITLTPAVRLYSQSAANFYYDPVYDPVVGAPYPPGYFTNPPQYLSPDQRLSAFGGVTLGLKLGVQISADWSADLKGERYEQRGSWRVGGAGSPGLEPFTATFWQLGMNKRF